MQFRQYKPVQKGRNGASDDRYPNQTPMKPPHRGLALSSSWRVGRRGLDIKARRRRRLGLFDGGCFLQRFRGRTSIGAFADLAVLTNESIAAPRQRLNV